MSASSPGQDRNQLRPVSAFAGIQDQSARSRALFGEPAKVITHPRCVNCHPATDRPLQGDDQHPHEPPVLRGEAGVGVPGLSCAACHIDRHVEVVGAPRMKASLGIRTGGWHRSKWRGRASLRDKSARN